jgi:hypothetical protein
MKDGNFRRDEAPGQFVSSGICRLHLEKDHALMSTEAAKQAKARRIVPRYPFEARFKIRIDRPKGPLETEGWARDLSESGLCAFVATQIKLGEFATLRIPLGHARELVLPAKVTRIVGTEYGFQFTALSAEQRDQILGAVADKTPIPYQATSG